MAYRIHDLLTEGMRRTILTAQLIAADATVVIKPDKSVQLFADTAQIDISFHEMAVAQELLATVENDYCRPYGIVRPYNSHRLILMRDVLEEVLCDKVFKKDFRVGFIKGDAGGCAYWRIDEPARLLEQKYGDKIYVETGNNINIETLLAFDIIVVQRGLYGRMTHEIMAIIERLKNAGRQIIYEVDDDLRTMLQDNNCLYFAGPNEMAAVNWLHENSDAIFVTTQELANSIGFLEKTYILPNSIDLSKAVPVKRSTAREKIIEIMWHGGDSHQRDLSWVEKALCRFLEYDKPKLEDKTGKDIIVIFMGYMPHIVEKYTTYEFNAVVDANHEDRKLGKTMRSLTVTGRHNIKYIKPVPPDQFHSYLAHLDPDICFCPLIPDHKFQDAKSNCKWIESSIAGAACVLSDIGPYRFIPDDCAIKVRTPEQMIQGIKELVVNDIKRKQLHDNSMALIRQNYSLEDNVDLWYNALSDVYQKRKPIARGLGKVKIIQEGDFQRQAG